MRKLLPVAAVFAAFMIGAPALADSAATTAATGASTTTTTAKDAPPDPNERVCKRVEVTGSRIPGARECHTRREWAEMSDEGRDATTQSQQRGFDMGPLKGN